MSVTTNISNLPVFFNQDQICQWYCCECGKCFGNVYYREEENQNQDHLDPKQVSGGSKDRDPVTEGGFNYEYDLVSTVKYYSSIIYNSKDPEHREECLTPVSSENVTFDFPDVMQRSNSVNLPVDSNLSVKSLPLIPSSPLTEGTTGEITASVEPDLREKPRRNTDKSHPDNGSQYDDLQLSPLEPGHGLIEIPPIDQQGEPTRNSSDDDRPNSEGVGEEDTRNYNHYVRRYPPTSHNDAIYRVHAEPNIKNSKDKYLIDTPKRYNCNRCSHMMCPYCPKLRVRDLYK